MCNISVEYFIVYAMDSKRRIKHGREISPSSITTGICPGYNGITHVFVQFNAMQVDSEDNEGPKV